MFLVQAKNFSHSELMNEYQNRVCKFVESNFIAQETFLLLSSMVI